MVYCPSENSSISSTNMASESHLWFSPISYILQHTGEIDETFHLNSLMSRCVRPKFRVCQQISPNSGSLGIFRSPEPLDSWVSLQYRQAPSFVRRRPSTFSNDISEAMKPILTIFYIHHLRGRIIFFCPNRKRILLAHWRYVDKSSTEMFVE